MSSLSSWHALRAGNEKAYYDVFWLMQHHLGISWGDLQTKSLDDYPKQSVEALEEDIKAYKDGKPLAYLVGNVDFYELNFEIQEGVLIPRLDTEPMVSEIIQRLDGNEKILELGTGSGAIACAIAYHRPNCKIVAVERSDIAYKVAKRNVEKLGLQKQIKVIQASWYDLSLSGFDWVVSNPPYIAKGDPDMTESVSTYEPKEALESEDNGLKDLLFIVQNAKKWLVSNGFLALEHGYLQQVSVKKALVEAGYIGIYLGKDQIHPRYVIAKKA